METSNDIQLQLSKEFSVPPDRLFKAWTTEEELREWWKPMNNTLSRLVNELNVGGKLAYSFTTAEGHEAFIIQGVYEEVVPQKKLVYTWNWQLPSPSIEDTDFLLTIEFLPSAKGSRLLVTQEQFTEEEAVQPHREGWEKGLNNLADYLQKNVKE